MFLVQPCRHLSAAILHVRREETSIYSSGTLLGSAWDAGTLVTALESEAAPAGSFMEGFGGASPSAEPAATQPLSFRDKYCSNSSCKKVIGNRAQHCKHCKAVQPGMQPQKRSRIMDYVAEKVHIISSLVRSPRAKARKRPRVSSSAAASDAHASCRSAPVPSAAAGVQPSEPSLRERSPENDYDSFGGGADCDWGTEWVGGLGDGDPTGESQEPDAEPAGAAPEAAARTEHSYAVVGSGCKFGQYLDAVIAKASSLWPVSVSKRGVTVQAVADFMYKEEVLYIDVHHPVHVTSIPMEFSDVKRMAYLCSCDEMKHARLSAVGADSRLSSFSDWNGVLQPCMHVQATQHILAASDGRLVEELRSSSSSSSFYHNISDAMLDNEDPLAFPPPGERSPSDPLLLSAGFHRPDGTPCLPQDRVFISADSCDHYLCLTCKDYSCPHVDSLVSWLTGQDSGEEEARPALQVLINGYKQRPPGFSTGDSSSGPVPKSVSNVLIEPQCSSHPVMNARGRGLLSGWLPRCGYCVEHQCTLCTHCVPSLPSPQGNSDGTVSCCPLCKSAWSAEDPVAEGWVEKRNCKLLHRSGMQYVNEYSRHCSVPGCQGRLFYDGSEDAVFNFTPEHKFTYELCFGFFNDVLHQPLTFNAYYLSLRDAFALAGQLGDMCSRNTIRLALQAFLRLLDIPVDKCYGCPFGPCNQGEHGELTVTCDGTTVGYRKGSAKEYVPPDAAGAASVPDHMSRKDAVALPRARARKLVRKWASGDGISIQKWKELVDDELSETSLIKIALHYATSGQEGQQQKCKAELQPLFKAISAEYPVCSFIDSSFATELRQILRGSITIVEMQKFHRHCVVLHHAAMHGNWREVPGPLKNMLDHLCFQAGMAKTCDEVPFYAAPVGAEEDHVYMPEFPILRGLPPWAADTARKDTDTQCTKAQLRHNGLTPGLFLIFCAHGICLGFMLMPQCEGPSMLFKLLFTRFRHGPKRIVYDNCCNLMRYCLRRAPRFFSETQFLIDRLHIFNHTACSAGFNPQWYDQSIKVAEGITLSTLNTQICEQTNSQLAKIRTSVAYMHHDNVVSFVKYYMAMLNITKIERLRAQQMGR